MLDVSSSLLQLALESRLNTGLGLDDNTPLPYIEHYWPNVATYALSHAAVAAVTTPFQVVLTRCGSLFSAFSLHFFLRSSSSAYSWSHPRFLSF